LKEDESACPEAGDLRRKEVQGSHCEANLFDKKWLSIGLSWFKYGLRWHIKTKKKGSQADNRRREKGGIKMGERTCLGRSTR